MAGCAIANHSNVKRLKDAKHLCRRRRLSTVRYRSGQPAPGPVPPQRDTARTASVSSDRVDRASPVKRSNQWCPWSGHAHFGVADQPTEIWRARIPNTSASGKPKREQQHIEWHVGSAESGLRRSASARNSGGFSVVCIPAYRPLWFFAGATNTGISLRTAGRVAGALWRQRRGHFRRLQRR